MASSSTAHPLRDEVLAIVEPRRQIAIEETWRTAMIQCPMALTAIGPDSRVRRVSGDIDSTEAMARIADIRIGTAGWSIPRAAASRFDSAGTHLQRYSRRLDCAEINSSFHRPHAATTYAKWRDSTPPDFRFAVKIPRAITHELKLQDAREPFVTFLAQTDGLADKRGPLLLQLPPSLSFDGSVVTAFLEVVRRVYDGPLVCEPRHATWFSPLVTSLLERYRISRVAADPPPVPDAAHSGRLGARRVFPAARLTADVLVAI